LTPGQKGNTVAYKRHFEIEAKIQGNREITELAKTVDRLKADGVTGL
jgi:hypothetical protein